MTQIFIARAELLPPGETTDYHKKRQQEEADIVEKDRKSENTPDGGLFRGFFDSSRWPAALPIRDVEDGVDRCPRCAWELLDGACESCGFNTSDSTSYVSPLSDPENSTSSLPIYRGTRRWPMEDDDFLSEESIYGDIEPSDDSDHELRSEHITGNRSGLLHSQQRTTREAHGSSGFYPSQPLQSSDTETEDESEDIDDYITEDDDDLTGSLHDFVVNDGEDGPYSVQNSPRGSQHSPYEARLAQHLSDEYDNRYEDSEAQSARENQGRSSPFLTDDSDQSPRQPTRRHMYPPNRTRRLSYSRGSDRLNNAALSMGDSMQHGARRRNDLFRELHASHQSRHMAADPSRGRRDVPIEIDSESESLPPPIHRLGRRRGANRIISDDEDNSTASPDNILAPRRQSSSGTATLGRKSPSLSTTRNLNTQTFGPPSPIVINSNSNMLDEYGWSPYQESTTTPIRESPQPRTAPNPSCPDFLSSYPGSLSPGSLGSPQFRPLSPRSPHSASPRLANSPSSPHFLSSQRSPLNRSTVTSVQSTSHPAEIFSSGHSNRPPYNSWAGSSESPQSSSPHSFTDNSKPHFYSSIEKRWIPCSPTMSDFRLDSGFRPQTTSHLSVSPTVNHVGRNKSSNSQTGRKEPDQPRGPNRINTNSFSRNPPPRFARSIRDRSLSETTDIARQVAAARSTRRAERHALKLQKRRRERKRDAPATASRRHSISSDGSAIRTIQGRTLS